MFTRAYIYCIFCQVKLRIRKKYRIEEKNNSHDYRTELTMAIKSPKQKKAEGMIERLKIEGKEIVLVGTAHVSGENTRKGTFISMNEN